MLCGCFCMSWRVVSISKQSYLSLHHENLLIRQDDEEFSVPLEDIGVLLIESRQTVLSAALIDACVRHKVALFVCDEKHLPSGILLGYQQHSRQSGVIAAQLAMTEPFKKRLWQRVVIRKIQNQEAVCRAVLGNVSSPFSYYAKTVHSGDPLNREATAARVHFSSLFPPGVTRETDHVLNAGLNYGYAILRGAMARALASYGFLTSMGIMHVSELNNFALADDLMEPYRPFVDDCVFRTIKPTGEELTKEMRDSILAILTTDTLIGEKNQSILRAVELTAQSLVTAIEEKDPERLLLPMIV